MNDPRENREAREIEDVVLVEREDFTPNRKTKIIKLKEENKLLNKNWEDAVKEIGKLQTQLNNQAISIKSYQEDLKKAGDLLEEMMSFKNNADNFTEANHIINVMEKAKEFLKRIREIG